MDPKADKSKKLGRSITTGRLTQTSPMLKRSTSLPSTKPSKKQLAPSKQLAVVPSKQLALAPSKKPAVSKQLAVVPAKKLAQKPAAPKLARSTTLPTKPTKLGRSTTLPARPATKPTLSRLSSMPARPKPANISSATQKKNKFAETLKGSKPVEVEGGVPLFALLNSEEHGEQNHRVRVPKYNLFKEGELVTDPRYVRELTNAEKKQLAARPPVCVGEKLVLSDPNSCFVRGMESRLKATYDEVAKYRGTSGNNPFCDVSNPKLQTHQQGIFELARAMATRTPEELDGSRGLLCYHSTGSGKCIQIDTKVVAYDGSLVRAGDLEPGMKLLGMDGTPRTVLDVGRGWETMYEIRPTKGEAWRCNASHMLSLKYTAHGLIHKTRHDTYTVLYHESNDVVGAFRSTNFKTREDAETFSATLDKNHIVDIPVKEYLTLPKSVKEHLKLFRSGPVDFAPRPEPEFDPYVLGAWLGDGHSDGPTFTLGDKELVAEIVRRTSGTGLRMVVQGNTASYAAPGYRLRTDDGARNGNPFMDFLRRRGLVKNKHIPLEFKASSRENRLALLAGLLDTDGYLGGNCFEITQKNKTLADDIAFVARSLGFAAYIREVTKDCVKPDGTRVAGLYYKISISGEGLEDVPTVLERKKASPRQQKKDARRTGFEIVELEVGEYAGPVLDGDRRYLIWDFTVTHNTVTSLGIVLAFWDSPRNIVLATTPDNAGDNNLSKYSANLFKMFPDYVGKVFPNAPPTLKAPWTSEKNAQLDAWCKDPNNIKPMTNRVRTFTFTTLASALCLPKEGALGQANPIGPTLLMGKYGGKCGESATNESKVAKGGKVGSVLIMDEVQSLFTPDPKFARAAKFLSKELVQEKYRKRMFVFALTATPGNNVENMLDVLNFVRPLGVPVLTANDIKSNPAKFRGMVSYADIRGDTSRYGIKTVKNIYVPMNDKYYVGFLRAIGKLTAENLNYSKAERASKELGFLSKQKAAGNSLAKTSLTGLYTEAELKEFTTAKGSGGVIRAVDIGRGQLRLLSDKLRAALANAMNMPGKQYLYISDGTTNKVVIALLEKMGYSPITSKDYVRQGKKYIEGPRLATKAPRFIMYRTGAVTSASGAKETLDENILKAYSGTFGARKNDDGGYAKIIIASGTFYQGFDTRALQGVHLIDPLFNVAADKQAVGRGLRLCGHSGAPSNKVTVYRYFSVPPQKFDLQTIADSMKGAASKRVMELDTLAQEVSRLSSPANTKNVEGVEGPVPQGINTFIFKDAIRRNAPVDFFEKLLKAQAVDCKLFKPIFHANEPFQCGVIPSGSMNIPPFSPEKLVAEAKQAAKNNFAKKPLKNYRVSAEASKKLNEFAAKRGATEQHKGFFGGLFGSSVKANGGGYAKGGYAKGGYSSKAESVFARRPAEPKTPQRTERPPVPEPKRPNAVPQPRRPNAVPQPKRPNAVPQPKRPNAVPQPKRPNAVPQPKRPNANNWKKHFGLSGKPTERDVQSKFKKMAMKLHPNKGGSKEAFQKHVEMRNAALKEIRKNQKPVVEPTKKPEPTKSTAPLFRRKIKVQPVKVKKQLRRPAARAPKKRLGIFARRRAA